MRRALETAETAFQCVVDLFKDSQKEKGKSGNNQEGQVFCSAHLSTPYCDVLESILDEKKGIRPFSINRHLKFHAKGVENL